MTPFKKGVMVTSLIWITCLSSCAGLKVKWWLVDDKENQALVRKDSSGHVVETLHYIEAQGYFCLSQSDAEALINYCKQKP